MTFPAWRYGPNGAAKVFQTAADVPAGFEDHPSKVGKAMYPDDGGLKEPVRSFESTQSAVDVIKDHFKLDAPEPVEQPAPLPDLEPAKESAIGVPLTRKQITDALTERKVAFHKNAPTAKLYALLLETVEKNEA